MDQSLSNFLQTKTIGSHTLQEWSDTFREFLLTINDQFDPGHRIDHVERVVNNALVLANQEEGVSYEVVLPAIWLHDCVPVSKHSEKRPQASRISAERAAEILAERGYPLDNLPAIQHAISAHSYSAGITPESIEAKIVQDADRLDSLGAVGIARVCLIGGQFNNAIYHPVTPFCRGREPEEKSYIVDHFFTKLLKLAPSFHTESGRQEAQRRTAFMREYIQQLGGEIGIIPPLQQESA